MKKKLADINFKDKKVLVRVDFNVPLVDGVISDDNRIISAIPTIQYLLDHDAKVILLSHLGRIKRSEDLKKYSLKPVAKRLAELLGIEVNFVDEISGVTLQTAINSLENKQILLMENTRFADLENKRESNNDASLGKYWASLGDVFVNDAFGTAHREHASNVGIATNINESCIGLLVEKELAMLNKAIINPERPVVVILGGAKVSDKIGVIDHLLKVADKIIIGGAMSYTFLKAQQFNIGKSLIEEDKIQLAKQYLQKANGKIILPIDHLMSKEFVDQSGINSTDANIADDYMGMDIGEKTITLFNNYIKEAKTIIWNGPVGVFEMKNFSKGTLAICETIAHLNNVFSIVGGGDSTAAAIQLGFKDKFSYISTGGGASLELLEGKPLPAIEVIQDK
ncbi:phosphoglycerate kinase [Spiroplasma endosymbiont of Nephrotoma flavescens]|uniref:phosphoglycerate kinase n=1 Tax=Spiroplasma endosymbiont of Nephrotoma flavescens TaxID=3066302 RepID=UPI00313E1610